MDVDLGTVPVEQARIARHALKHAIRFGAFWDDENYRAAHLALAWFDYRIDRTEFLAQFVEELK